MAEAELAPEQRYSIVVAALRSRPGVSVRVPRKRGLGTSALCVHDRIFAMLSSNRQLVVRLPKNRVAALILAGRGAHFEPSHGQPLHEWLVAGVQLDEQWLSLAEEALSFAEADPKLVPEPT